MNNRVQVDAAFVILFIFTILHKIRLSQKCLLAFCALHFLWFCKNPISPLNVNTDADSIVLHTLYRDSFIFLGMSLLLVHIKPRVDAVLRILVFFSAAWLVLWRFKVTPYSGFSGVHSMDASFVALGSAYFTGWKRWFVCLAAISTNATAPIVVVSLLNFMGDWRLFLAISLVVVGFLLFGLEVNVTSPDRVAIWRQALEYVVYTDRWLLGAGLGSFGSIGALFDGLSPFQSLATHNEFVQLFFEYGLLGTLFFAWAGIDEFLRISIFNKKVVVLLCFVAFFHSVFRQHPFFALFLL